MTQEEALRELGVRADTLTDEEKAGLDRDGFVVLHSIVTDSQASAMRSSIEATFAATHAGEPDGPPECGNLQNGDDVFDICFTHPRVLAAVAHVLREEFLCLGVHSRPNPPGRGHQALHVDWGGAPATAGEYCVCNTIWPFVDFTALNGATRLVPGSHLFGKHPIDSLADPEAHYPGEITLEIPAGSVCIFNSHVWHGATLNRSASFRPNVTCYWSRRHWPGREIAPNRLSPAASARLPEAAKRLYPAY